MQIQLARLHSCAAHLLANRNVRVLIAHEKLMQHGLTTLWGALSLSACSMFRSVSSSAACHAEHVARLRLPDIGLAAKQTIMQSYDSCNVPRHRPLCDVSFYAASMMYLLFV